MAASGQPTEFNDCDLAVFGSYAEHPMPLIEILADISPGQVDDQWLIGLARSGGRRLLTVAKPGCCLRTSLTLCISAYSGT